LIEQRGYSPTNLTPLGEFLYNYNSWESDSTVANSQPTIQLTAKQIAFFKRYGFVVIQDCIPLNLIDSLNTEIYEKLRGIAGIDPENLLASTKVQWNKVAGRFGGMLELYFLKGQEDIREHPNPYWATVQLLENTWFAQNNAEIGFGHPIEGLNPRHLWLYVDRMNFRLPETIMEKISSK